MSLTIEAAYAINNEARAARKQGFAPAASDTDIIRARIAIERHLIAHPAPFAPAWATPTRAEREDQIYYLENELQRLSERTP